jgi:hypothetical protein
MSSIGEFHWQFDVIYFHTFVNLGIVCLLKVLI